MLLAKAIVIVCFSLFIARIWYQMNTIVHVNLVLKPLFSFHSFSFLIHLVWITLCWLFLLSLSLFLVWKFPVLRVLLPHCYYWCYDLPDAVTLLLLSLLFHSSKCIREFYESETLSWDRTAPYRATSFCVRTCVIRFIFQLCVHTHANHVQTLATATATAISYWWSKLVSFVTFFVRFFHFPTNTEMFSNWSFVTEFRDSEQQQKKYNVAFWGRFRDTKRAFFIAPYLRLVKAFFFD